MGSGASRGGREAQGTSALFKAASVYEHLEQPHALAEAGPEAPMKLDSFTERPEPAPVLVLYAHPNPKSFNHAILEQIRKRLRARGKAFLVRDLCAMNFNPVLGLDDLAYPSEDVGVEQQYVIAAELIVVIHPVWWFSFPAVLKGYFDRVFSFGFAFGPGEGGTVGNLSGKRALVVSTTGASREVYDEAAAPALRLTMEVGLLQYCGIEVVDHHYCYAVATASAEERRQMLADLDTKFTALL
eukprot:m51a1_g9644 hypothetical protein (242) ;mRNA; f:1168126-1168908